MRLNPEQINILKEELCAELVEILMDEWHYSMQEALGVLYNSDTFALIQDEGSTKAQVMFTPFLMKN